VLAKPDFVKPSMLHPIPVKMMFLPLLPWLKVLMISPEAMLCLSVTMLKNSGCQKAHIFGLTIWLMTQQARRTSGSAEEAGM